LNQREVDEIRAEAEAKGVNVDENGYQAVDQLIHSLKEGGLWEKMISVHVPPFTMAINIKRE